ncbi:nitroreductase family protein [Cohnella yongneupensis]|uniref:Putative NAD(P)H nitroreductase n=1 Tax=Cohnella yongneupensis TaxID=425006 RepID=A0ABW0R3R1_9BACL
MSELQRVIKERRSIGRVKADSVPKELIEQMIEAAVWAPNHHGTEPWRFIVMTGEGRCVLGQAYVDFAAGALQALEGDELQERIAKEIAKAYRSPVVIAAICSPSANPKAVRAEELAATHAAVQNLLLTAHDVGLAAIWRTGDPAYHPTMKAALEVAEHEEVVGLIFVGYPELALHAGKRVPGAEKTRWIEE